MGKRSTKPESFIEKTYYPGGGKAMAAFIAKHLKYPQEALDNRIEGKVTLELDIDKNGRVIRTRVKSGLGYGCDEEAQRLASLMRFSATKNKKVRVEFHKTIHIPFQLPPQGQKLTYNITTSKAPDSGKSEQKPQNSGYIYGIKLATSPKNT